MSERQGTISDLKAILWLIFALVLFWFGYHLPLFPSTLYGWLAAFGSLVIFVIAGALLVPALSYAESKSNAQKAWKVLGAVLACTLGVGVFVAEYVWRDFISQNFTSIFRW